MNMRIFLVGGFLAFVGFVGVAQADTTNVQPVPYHYGMPLHIAKVVSLTEPSTPECKVITADMKFIDKTGNPAEITYLKLSEACTNQG